MEFAKYELENFKGIKGAIECINEFPWKRKFVDLLKQDHSHQYDKKINIKRFCETTIDENGKKLSTLKLQNFIGELDKLNLIHWIKGKEGCYTTISITFFFYCLLRDGYNIDRITKLKKKIDLYTTFNKTINLNTVKEKVFPFMLNSLIERLFNILKKQDKKYTLKLNTNYYPYCTNYGFSITEDYEGIGFDIITLNGDNKLVAINTITNTYKHLEDLSMAAIFELFKNIC